MEGCVVVIYEREGYAFMFFGAACVAVNSSSAKLRLPSFF
ncbi:hypothetical Protein YC6258_04318 [Gynuella sunshinyii YC6258]|uniref:Uncharacterized protein n=1 Tax=Gynuella sunshinyii YC6258 TaxID=1445510 RepID=A0A0C5VNV1_9GAMM|nr:hypothetical Protein YC6258_04318 [Gynuella sunshinyii YC6258]